MTTMLDWHAAWQALIHHPLFGVGVTLAAFQLSFAAYEKTRWVFLQPARCWSSACCCCAGSAMPITPTARSC